MKHEVYEIPEKNMGEDNVKECIKMLLNKLHTHQEFCANTRVKLIFDNNHKEYSFALHKGKYLYINDKNAIEYTLDELKMISDNCPITSFVSKYNQTVYDYAKGFLNEGKCICEKTGIYNNGDYSNIYYSDYGCEKWYICITDVSIKMNRVILTYKEFSITGDDWDENEFSNNGYSTCVIDKYWSGENLKTKNEFNNEIENAIKNALFEYTQKIQKTLLNISNDIQKL